MSTRKQYISGMQNSQDILRVSRYLNMGSNIHPRNMSLILDKWKLTL